MAELWGDGYEIPGGGPLFCIDDAIECAGLGCVFIGWACVAVMALVLSPIWLPIVALGWIVGKLTDL